MKKINYLTAIFALAILVFSGCKKKEKDMTKEFQDFLKGYEAKVAPLFKEASLAGWDAALTGKKEDFKRQEELNIKLTNIFTNKEEYNKLKEIKESGKITDPILIRELNLIFNEYMKNQVDTAIIHKIISKETKISEAFNNFRAKIGEKEFSDNEIEGILANSKNSDSLKAAWEAHKRVGEVVAKEIIELAKLRNQQAKSLGFSNFQEMRLKLDYEQDPKEILRIFDELDGLTKDAFAKLKGDVDKYYEPRYKVKKDQLRPWHYQNRFFQDAPKIYPIDFDKYYTDKNIETLTSNYFTSIGLPVDEIMKKSDLYEKKGKDQGAFCSNLDKKKDVRISCNIKPNSRWMGTMLHEFGHGVYDFYVAPTVPFTIHGPAQTFTTEAIAMLFGRFSTNGQWLKDNVGISDDEKKKVADIGFKSLQLEQLTFSRWVQVMYRFEKALYENPDQDLNKTWWDLVEKYQMLTRPENRNAPDWASKSHIATAACYYHNYLLGELLASQLHYYIVKNIIKSDDYQNQSYFNNKEVGTFLKTKVFEPGQTYFWNDMIEKATGEKLTPKYYAKQFVNPTSK